jgi:hypothetical protein
MLSYVHKCCQQYVHIGVENVIRVSYDCLHGLKPYRGSGYSWEKQA